MRSARPALVPVFRSGLQAEILAALLLAPDRSYSMTDRAKRFGAPLSTVHDEAQRLTKAGLLNRHDAGRSAMLQANARNRITKPLTELLLLSSGPQHVVVDEFSDLPGAEQVVIVGFWPARYHH